MLVQFIQLLQLVRKLTKSSLGLNYSILRSHSYLFEDWMLDAALNPQCMEFLINIQAIMWNSSLVLYMDSKSLIIKMSLIIRNSVKCNIKTFNITISFLNLRTIEIVEYDFKLLKPNIWELVS